MSLIYARACRMIRTFRSMLTSTRTANSVLGRGHETRSYPASQQWQTVRPTWQGRPVYREPGECW